MTDYLADLEREKQAITQMLNILQSLPNDTVRRRALNYVRERAVTPRRARRTRSADTEQ